MWHCPQPLLLGYCTNILLTYHLTVGTYQQCYRIINYKLLPAFAHLSPTSTKILRFFVTEFQVGHLRAHLVNLTRSQTRNSATVKMTRCALKRNNKNVPKMWPKHLIVCLKPLKRFSLQTAGLYKHKPCFQIDQHNELEKYIDRDQAGRLGWRTFPRTDWMFRRSKVALFLALNFIDKWQNFIGLRHYTALLKRLVQHLFGAFLGLGQAMSSLQSSL